MERKNGSLFKKLFRGNAGESRINPQNPRQLAANHTKLPLCWHRPRMRKAHVFLNLTWKYQVETVISLYEPGGMKDPN